jgi:hypothetical protein
VEDVNSSITQSRKNFSSEGNTLVSIGTPYIYRVVYAARGKRRDSRSFYSTLLHPTPLILHPYLTITPLEKNYQWSTTGVEWSIGGVGSEKSGVSLE